MDQGIDSIGRYYPWVHHSFLVVVDPRIIPILIPMNGHSNRCLRYECRAWASVLAFASSRDLDFPPKWAPRMWGRLGESRFQGLAKRRAGHAVGAGQNEILQATGFKQAPHARSIRRKRVIAYKAQLKPRHAHTTEV
jgi:hypothetical protein